MRAAVVRRVTRALVAAMLLWTAHGEGYGPLPSRPVFLSERDALLAWKSSLDNPEPLVDWTEYRYPWWPGVMYDKAGHVVGLKLNWGLSGGLHALDLAAFPMLVALDLSYNNLTGTIPDTWGSNMRALLFVDLANNLLSGEILTTSPSPILNCSLQAFHLDNNSFTGVFPSVLEGCNALVNLVLGNNMFSGSIPPWIGPGLPSLRFLSLGSNNFSGEIPSTLTELSQLQILDLSDNNLVGPIPVEFGNLYSMKHPINASAGVEFPYLRDFFSVTWKGRTFDFYPTVQQLVTGIDLSGNALSECIPRELSNLQDLRFLNLSRNQLSCSIPETIGNLAHLESLDLSMNQLSGNIPSGISNLLSLGVLDLSNNHLSGKIPTGHQIQTFTDPSIYYNNSGLCGFPLAPCADDVSPPPAETTQINVKGHEDPWVYYCVIAGIVFGFWLWFGMLFGIMSFRTFVFNVTDGMHCEITQILRHSGLLFSTKR